VFSGDGSVMVVPALPSCHRPQVTAQVLEFQRAEPLAASRIGVISRTSHPFRGAGAGAGADSTSGTGRWPFR
jgi:hypothetical protein